MRAEKTGGFSVSVVISWIGGTERAVSNQWSGMEATVRLIAKLNRACQNPLHLCCGRVQKTPHNDRTMLTKALAATQRRIEKPIVKKCSQPRRCPKPNEIAANMLRIAMVGGT
jgi:hypothetical protein